MDTKIDEKEKISICDLTKTNTIEILQKIEYQIPLYLQEYTDLFTKYIHSFNIIIGAVAVLVGVRFNPETRDIDLVDHPHESQK